MPGGGVSISDIVFGPVLKHMHGGKESSAAAGNCVSVTSFQASGTWIPSAACRSTRLLHS